MHLEKVSWSFFSNVPRRLRQKRFVCKSKNDGNFRQFNGSLDTRVLSSGAANDAFTICDFLNANPAGGYASITNWRVPTKNELVNFTFESTATEFSSLFPNRLNGDYWSANSYIASIAHFVDQNGSSFGTAKDATIHVRCVSSGH